MNSSKSNFHSLAIVLGAVYFFSLNGLASLPNLSVDFILKERLGLTATGLAYFQALTLLAWVIKPLWGYLSDSYPLFGTRRKSYLLLTSALAGFAWLVLANAREFSVTNLFFSITLSTMAYAFQDVVTDGLMVEVGQPLGLTGQFQSVQWACVYAALIMTGLGGGWVSDLARKGVIPYQRVFAVTALFPLWTLGLAAFLVREPRAAPVSREGKPRLREIFSRRDLWLVALFLFSWNFSPSAGAPFFYYAVDTLKFSGQFLGLLQALAGVSALIGSILFGKFFANLPMRKFFIAVVISGVIVTLFNLLYFLPGLVARPGILRGISIMTAIPFGMLNIVLFLTLMNLAASVAPPRAGGMVFAFLMSFWNLGQMGSNMIGGLLLPVVGLQWLIVISAFFSLTALFFLPYLSIAEPLTNLEKCIKGMMGRIIR